MTSKNLKKSTCRSDMINLRFGVPLLALLLIAAPSPSQASDTLHFISAKRTSEKHVYKFAGYFNYNGDIDSGGDRKSMSRVGFYDDVTYYPASGFAVQVMTMTGGYTDTVTSDWGCTDDPWLNPQAKCTQEKSSTSFSYSMYLYQYCPGGEHGHWCLAGLGLVPQAVVKLMRHGPPAPSVSGVKFTHQAPVKATLHYAANSADHFQVDEWYCPPGKDEAPNYIPNGDSASFPGGACQDSKRGPLSLTKSANTASFGIGQPAGQPKNGTWYVRARLDSASYGTSLWGHWHRTAVQLPMHFKDAPNNKPAPTIVAPAEGHVFSEPNAQVALELKSNVAPENDNAWYYDIEWQRQRYVTEANAKVYDALHKGGFPSQIGALEAMHPWSLNSRVRVQASTATVNSLMQLDYQEARPRSVEFSYRYRVRARDDGSNWSPWRYFIVEETLPNSSGFRRSASALEPMPTQSPDILSPSEDQVFAEAVGAPNKYVRIEVRPNVKNPKPDHWRVRLEWKRAEYYTKANNDMYYCKYGQPKKNGFSRQTGVVSAPTVWDEIMTPTSGWLNSDNSMWDPQFGTFAPNSTMYSYLYKFRVRAQRISPEAYGPWSPWRSFIVENTGFNQCTAVKTKGKPRIGGIGIHVSGQTQQQSGQHSQQRALRPSTMRIGSAVPHTLALQQPAPVMHTMSGSLNPSNAPRRYARTGLGGARASARSAPHLRVVSHTETVDRSCANLARFITIRETVMNDGGPLAAGRARLYVKETGGAHLSSRAVPVPALAHGAMRTLTVKAGTGEAYRAKVPGPHTLPVVLVVNGKATATNVVEGLRPNLCQVHRRTVHPLRRMPSVKLNPQPEPPSAPRTLAIPHR
jgi:hypothetical protein